MRFIPHKTSLPDIEKLLLGRNQLSFIQVGALDGVSFDPLYPLIAKNVDWHGLVIEPVPHAYTALCETYKNRSNVKPINLAIDPKRPSVTIYYVQPSAELPDWTKGISSLYTDRNSLSGKSIPASLSQAIRAQIRHINSPATTLNALVEKFDIKHLDWLQIDTEGHDWQVLRSLKLRRLRPKYIHLEYYNLPKHEKALLFLHLYLNNYKVLRDHKDILAISS